MLTINPYFRVKATPKFLQLGSSMVSAIALCSAGMAHAQDAGEEQAKEQADVSTTETADNAAQNNDAEILVTGSRIDGTPPASPVSIISRTEIDLRGLSTVEDVLRYIPQNFSSITSGGAADGRRARNSDGAATVNLRGLGEGSTLVLVNGKRIAASATESGTFTDISTIPFGAIERVEVLTDGASAVYGSDAVGGVINFILKKDYTGAQTRVRYENSSSGGDAFRVDQTLGFGWGSGNLTANVSYTEEDPVNRFDAGLTDISDFTAQGGRSFPARSNFFQNGQPMEREALAPLFLTPETDQFSAYVNIDQDITSFLALNLNAQYSKRDSTSSTVAATILTDVPATNFFNTTGALVRNVRYPFLAETDAGLIDPPRGFTSSERYSFNGSLDWKTPIKDWKLTAGFGYSADENTSSNIGIDLDNPAVQAALSSADQATALNLFGDGSTQLGNLSSLFTENSNGSRVGEQRFFNLGLNGTAFTLPAGPVKFSIGGELRKDSVDYKDFRFNPVNGVAGIGTNAPELQDFSPEIDNQSVFFELFIPLVDSKSDIPLIRELSIQVAGRYDNYDFSGPFDGFDGTDPFNPVLLPFSSRSFDNFVPKIGVVWYPIDDLKLRGTWGEAFQVPTIPELFNPRFVDNVFTTFFSDPLNPAGSPASCGPPFSFFIPDCVEVPSVFGGNPDLQPVTSETWTGGFDYSPSWIDDLDISFTYSRISFDGQISSFFDVFGFNDIFGPAPFAIVNSDLFPNRVIRDENGVLTFFDPAGPFNIASRETETIDFSVKKGFETSIGRFDLGVAAAHILKQEDIAAEGVPPVTLAGTDFGPPTWNINTTLDWYKDEWRVNLIVNYTDSYTNTDPDANITTIDGYTTVDLTVGYRLPDSGWNFSIGVNNLFDAEFPFVDARNPVDSRRVDFRRRVFFIDISKEFSI